MAKHYNYDKKKKLLGSWIEQPVRLSGDHGLVIFLKRMAIS